MTDHQKQHIINLRAEGKPYKEIADELGLTLGSVKMFMSRRKREGERRKCEMRRKYLPRAARSSQRLCCEKCKRTGETGNGQRNERKRRKCRFTES